jgi:hypothetical protein
MKTNSKVEFGDFQTPLVLARAVSSFLVQQGVKAKTVLEPTCGVGSFLVAASESFPKARLLGWDINPKYVTQAKSALAEAGAAKRAFVGQQDFFAHDWEAELADIRGPLLVLGNLPWVTNAAVSGINGSNVPVKENFQGFRGIAARTGKSQLRHIRVDAYPTDQHVARANGSHRHTLQNSHRSKALAVRLAKRRQN